MCYVKLNLAVIALIYFSKKIKKKKILKCFKILFCKTEKNISFNQYIWEKYVYFIRLTFLLVTLKKYIYLFLT